VGTADYFRWKYSAGISTFNPKTKPLYAQLTSLRHPESTFSCRSGRQIPLNLTGIWHTFHPLLLPPTPQSGKNESEVPGALAGPSEALHEAQAATEPPGFPQNMRRKRCARWEDSWPFLFLSRAGKVQSGNLP